MKVTTQIIPTLETPHSAKTTSPDYYVFFWRYEGSFDGIPNYHRESYALSKCSSVLEAIEWESRNAEGRISATLLPIPSDDGESATLILLHGEYPDGSESVGQGFTGNFRNA